MASAMTSAMPSDSSTIPADPRTTTTTSPTRRPQKKKKADSFAIFSNAPISPDATSEDLARQSLAERSSSPTSSDNEDDEPLWRRMLIVPLLSISFILSLFLVERSERQRRASLHSSSYTSSWSTFSLQNWLDPEPYQNPDDSTWHEGDGTNSSGLQKTGHVPHPKRQQWFVRRKHAKVGKLEITDAFDLSGTVMMLLLVLTCVVGLGLGWGAMQAYHGLVHRLWS